MRHGRPAIARPVVRASGPAATALPRPLKILLVEDNTDTRDYLAGTLASRGHDVRTAGRLASALREAGEHEFELLISDIELPDGSGLELMWKLRDRGPIKGIALSGFGSSDDIDQSLSAGFAEHLTKPVDFRRLEEAIQHVAAGNQGGEAAGTALNARRPSRTAWTCAVQNETWGTCRSFSVSSSKSCAGANPRALATRFVGKLCIVVLYRMIVSL